MSLFGTAVSGVSGFFSQYVLYILGTALAASLAFGGVEVVRLDMSQKDVTAAQANLKTANAQIASKDILIAVNSAAMAKLVTDGADLQKRVDASAVAIQQIEKKHAEDLKKILTENVLPEDAKCEDVAKWALAIAKRK